MEREDFEKLVETIKIMPLQADDTVVLKIKDDISKECSERLKKRMEELFDGRKVIVLAGGMDIEIIRPEDGDVLITGRAYERSGGETG
jgi:hypothetical protein